MKPSYSFYCSYSSIVIIELLKRSNLSFATSDYISGLSAGRGMQSDDHESFPFVPWRGMFRVSCHDPTMICWKLWLPLICSILVDYAALIRNQFRVLYKDTSVHNIVQFNSSFCSVNTVSFMMVFCIFTCYLLETHVVKHFIFLYLFIRRFRIF